MPPRIDTRSPLVAEMHSAAKGLTGVSVVTARHTKANLVLAWDGGLLVGVGLDRWVPPVTALVRSRRGVLIPAPTILDDDLWVRARNLGPDGQPLLSAQEIADAEADWWVGLLVAGVTWSKAKVRRPRNAPDVVLVPVARRTTVSALADMSARADGLESVWRAVTRSLGYQGLGGPAAQGCASAGVFVPESRSMTGQASIDVAAGAAGVSRFRALTLVARAVEDRKPVTVTFPEQSEAEALVPESFEDPRNAWATEASAPLSPRPVRLPQPPAPPEPETVQPEPVPGPEVVEPDPEPVVEPEPITEAEPPPAPEPAPVAPAAPAPIVVVVQQADLPPAPPPPVVVAPVPAGPTDPVSLAGAWLAGARDSRDLGVRAAILERFQAEVLQAAQAAREHVAEVSAEVDESQDRLAQAEAAHEQALAELADAEIKAKAAHDEVVAPAVAQVDQARSLTDQAADELAQARDALAYAQAQADEIAADPILTLETAAVAATLDLGPEPDHSADQAGNEEFAAPSAVEPLPFGFAPATGRVAELVSKSVGLTPDQARDRLWHHEQGGLLIVWDEAEHHRGILLCDSCPGATTVENGIAGIARAVAEHYEDATAHAV